MQISVVICARNPQPARLARVLAGLQTQDLVPGSWELLLVDNGSREPLAPPDWPRPLSARLVREPRAGLFHARLAAIAATASPLLVFIDDDTVPAPGFLRSLCEAFATDPRITCAGPRILAEYAGHPPAWLPEFAWALAIRDLGAEPLSWALADATPLPHFTPIGAGLALRTSALPAYVAHARVYENEILARSWIGQGRGGCEDKDLVLTLVRAGGRVAYVPDAFLTHLIPSERIAPAYLEKLLLGLGCLWVRTLHAHGMEERTAISSLGFFARAARAWIRCRAWRGPAHRLRWFSALGVFHGLAANRRDGFRYPTPAA